MQYVRLSAPVDGAAYPCRAQGARAPGCSRSRNSPTDDGGAVPPNTTSRMRSEQSDEQSAEQPQEVTHPEARITHRGICASPDTIFGSHRRSKAAEELYRKALSTAREQEAKLWELRAAASLARLRRDQGRRTEARDLLAPIYGWFTEGFDTPDLKEAMALIEELA